MKHTLLFWLLPFFGFSVIAEGDSTVTMIVQEDNQVSRVDSLLAFGDYLYENGFFKRALIEYRNALSIDVSGDVAQKEILDRISRCHLRLKEHAQAAGVFLQLARESDSDSAFVSYSTDRVLALVNGGQTDSAVAAAGDLLRHTGAPQAAALLTYLYLAQKKVPEADSALHRYDHDSGKGSALIDLSQSWVESFKTAPLKSGTTAGLLSAVLPGSGKVYAGQTWDGVSAFQIFAFSLLQCVDGFYRNGARSIKGWLFSGIALNFYIAGIYGSVLEVRSYNNRILSGKLDEIELSLRVQVLGR